MTSFTRRSFLATASAATATGLLSSPAIAQSNDLVVGTWGRHLR